jgi:glyoxylase-like metal-dependent hydrolase (beta-lactamase superfamily II)
MMVPQQPAEALRQTALTIERLPVGRHKANAYLIYSGIGSGAVLIDPGAEESVLLRRVSDLRLTIHAVLLTHAHWDHVGAVKAICDTFHAPALLHPGDVALLRAAPLYGFKIDQIRIELPSNVEVLTRDHLAFGSGLAFSVRHLPGHTEGGVSYRAGNTVFTGDIFLRSGPGRTDLPGGNKEALQSSIYQLWQDLKDDDVICPGHGKFWPANAARQQLAQWVEAR